MLPSAPVTAADARKVVTANVASPYSHGIDRVSRVIDTVDALHQRRQIDAQQKRAADTYRGAFDVLGGSVGAAMDFEKVRAGTPGAPPCPAALLAAETLRRARTLRGEPIEGRAAHAREHGVRFADRAAPGTPAA